MASYNGFLRKSPSHRLEKYFHFKGVETRKDFDWTSTGRGTELVESINGLLAELSDLKQDVLKAEIDHLASLANDNGLLSAEQVCAGQSIDLEGFEGVQDILLMLSVEHPHLIDRVSAQASLIQRTGGKQWSAFQFENDGKPWALGSVEAREGFLAEAIEILELPAHRQREADWFKVIRLHPITGEEIEILQATIYVEERAESELAFGPTNTLERQIVPKVVEVGLACNAQERVIEICAKGGKKVRDQYAKAFANHFAPESEIPVETPRREVHLGHLRSMPAFETEPADGIERVEVSSLDFFSSGGGFSRFERKGEGENIYRFLERRFGPSSPLTASGWDILGATIRIVVAASEEKRRRTLTVTLRAPNTTTLPNKTETDRQFVFGLLERWNLIAPPEKEAEVIEAA
ncbi:hypothetical protein SAMN04488515_2366 [Cognatiyoonia koreensis]|uniref:Uncharacterized protein n=1 Tax=Cognatiyoonia koreensis TaxID=364200 RepID=A0A1I0QZ86_9RHOB|nr:hypothetical protein [Cognatiyoonia koreensis]SEW32924.1 hypothetical protein SAMN04488515_2366 [Cognatiyoonia koreensis]